MDEGPVVTLLDHSVDVDDHEREAALGEDAAEAFGAGVGCGSGMLTPFVAQAIASRAAEAAYHLVLKAFNADEEWDSPAFVRRMGLAALLRWWHHRVLLAFAENLTSFSSSEAE